MNVKTAFTEHPSSVGESYFGHLKMAFGFSTKMICGGVACMLHGLFPFMFKQTGSKCIEDLHHCMVTHRDRRDCADTDTSMAPLAQSASTLKAAE